MGNRANVVFCVDDWSECGPTVYLHWNGGPESVYRFLDELDRRQVRSGDVSYETAQFVHVVADFFNAKSRHTLSLRIMNGPCEVTRTELEHIETDFHDNGFYLVQRLEDGTRKVRRFVLSEQFGPDGKRFWGLIELNEASVEAERERAYTAELPYSAIPAFFISLDKRLGFFADGAAPPVEEE